MHKKNTAFIIIYLLLLHCPIISFCKAIIDSTGTDELEIAGSFVFYQSQGTIKKITKNGQVIKTKETIEIKKIELSIIEGTLKIRAYLNDDFSDYYESKQPISLVDFNQGQGKLYHTRERSKVIIAQDFIRYIPILDYNLIPDDTDKSIELSIKNSKTTVYKSDKVRFNLKVYSDFLGVFSDKPNGLIQTEAALRIITNTRPILNLPFLFFSHVEPQVVVSRIDKEFQFTSIDNNATISRLSLLQRSPFQFVFKANLFKILSTKFPRTELNIGWQYNYTKILKSDSTLIYSYLTGPLCELNTLFKIGSAAGFEVSIQGLYQKLSENSLAHNKKSILASILRFQLYFPLSKKTPYNKFFVRLSFLNDPQNRKDNFQQLQVGYSIAFSNLFNKKY